MNYKEARQLFAAKVSQLRREKRMTQEELAELTDKTTDYISLLERGERSPSFEVILNLAEALDVPASYLLSFSQSGESTAILNTLIAEPVSPSVVEPVEEPITTENERSSDAKRLEDAMKSIQELQNLASEYGIADIFQDNGGKTLQLLILLGLRISPGREGNDAIDAEGKEYELKTINIALNRSGGVTTHHHLNEIILNKYPRVEAWYIGLYEGITLKEIYKLTPEMLEPKFKEWEEKVRLRNEPLNNPKIPLKLVRKGQLVYSHSK
ncbi:MAG: helix-turn-helix domain-containing protein [Oscillatoriales cyanobacterium]|jgi:transcriptional regulator with XRE-family HTH domain|nr:MAG: helix-turn-helix domain-containing protein [Oscillatoriales cyanobacterium]TAE19705.1 MAG: helix-turn-helix domain-containing protein [Oscillatoriales cyanobacterium]